MALTSGGVRRRFLTDVARAMTVWRERGETYAACLEADVEQRSLAADWTWRHRRVVDIVAIGQAFERLERMREDRQTA